MTAQVFTSQAHHAAPAAAASLRPFAVVLAEDARLACGDNDDMNDGAWRAEAAGLALCGGVDPTDALAVTRRLCAQGPCLPLGRSAAAFPSVEAAALWLEAHEPALTAQLEWIGTRAEFLLILRRRSPEDATAAIKAASALGEAACLRGLSGRRAAETAARAALRSDVDAVEAAIANALAPLVDAMAPAMAAHTLRTERDAQAPRLDFLRSPAPAGGVDLSILAPGETARTLAETASRLAERFQDRLDLRVCGPWPPYSFARLALEGLAPFGRLAQ